MKKIIFLPMIALVFSCANPKHDKILQPYKKMLAEYEASDINFPSSHNYYRMLNFDLNSLSDTIAKMHEAAFQDEKISALATKEISNWLRDSVFIGSSKTHKGSFVLDTTNMLTLEKPFEYYTGSKIKQGQDVTNKIFQNINYMHTVKIEDKKIYYYLVPTNGKFFKETAEYRIQTTGDYRPDIGISKGTSSMTNFRYSCNLYHIDWYIRMESDDFFDDSLALKISDSTYYYRWHVGR